MDRKTPLVWHFPYYHPERGFDTAPTSIGVADFVTSQTRPHSAIRDGDWKLLYFYEDERTELYNLAQDLSENNDLSVPEQEKTSRLQEKLEMSLGEMNARWPVQPD